MDEKKSDLVDFVILVKYFLRNASARFFSICNYKHMNLLETYFIIAESKIF